MEIVNLPGKVIHNGTVWPWIGSQHQNNRAIDVLYVGRLVRGKGVDTLVQSMSYLRKAHPILEIKTIVIGEGDLRARLERLTRKYQLEDTIKFLGVQNAETIRESMLASKTVIVPSEFHEPFGLVAIEALMAGCIPIVSNLGGILEECRGRAITFEAGNSKQLSEVIHRTLASLPKIEQEIFQSLEPASFSIGRMILDYDDHITKRLQKL
jgi:glycosyltransferase involved in cell wall biosynthesis